MDLSPVTSQLPTNSSSFSENTFPSIGSAWPFLNAFLFVWRFGGVGSATKSYVWCPMALQTSGWHWDNAGSSIVASERPAKSSPMASHFRTLPRHCLFFLEVFFVMLEGGMHYVQLLLNRKTAKGGIGFFNYPTALYWLVVIFVAFSEISQCVLGWSLFLENILIEKLRVGI